MLRQSPPAATASPTPPPQVQTLRPAISPEVQLILVCPVARGLEVIPWIFRAGGALSAITASLERGDIQKLLLLLRQHIDSDDAIAADRSDGADDGGDDDVDE